MSTNTLGLSKELNQYIVDYGMPPDQIMSDLIEETKTVGDLAIMQIAPEQGAFMELFTKLLAPKFCVEIGTFTGYSSISIARGLPPNGKLLCCDISEEWTSIAQKYWERTGLSDRIELKLAPALETLEALPSDVMIDLAFIDADKANYINYYEAILSRLAPNGVILVDNVLAGGQVVEAKPELPHAVAIKNFNEALVADKRTQNVMIPIADGLTMITLQ